MVMFGLTLAVLHAYYQVWTKAKKSATGILPFHVWTIAASHSLAISFMTADVFILLTHDAPYTWRAPVFLLSSVLGLSSLISVLRFELQRKKKLEAEGGTRRAFNSDSGMYG